MEILIVSKTRMGGAYCCVGGLELATGKSVRLLTENGGNQPPDTGFEIGAVWDLDYKCRHNPRPPHVEDVLVLHACFLRPQPDLARHLRERVRVWRGRPEALFDGLLCSTDAGSGYICEEGGIPARSTGFWIPDQDLHRWDYNGNVRFRYPSEAGIRTLKYVGVADPVDWLPEGTLLRVSLARWWRPNEGPCVDDRCYLQLSGWYLN